MATTTQIPWATTPLILPLVLVGSMIMMICPTMIISTNTTMKMTMKMRMMILMHHTLVAKKTLIFTELNI